MTKLVYTPALVLLLAVLAHGSALAQEEESSATATDEAAMEEAATSATSSLEQEELSDEEIEELLSEADEITDADLEDDVIAGEVIAVDEETDTLIIETNDGTVATLSASTNARVRGTRGVLLNPKPGDRVVVVGEATESSTGDVVSAGAREIVVSTADGDEERIAITDDVQVLRGGQPTTASSLRPQDVVVIIRTADGSVIAVDARPATSAAADGADEESTTDEAEEATTTDADDEEPGGLLWWILGAAAVVLVLGFLLFR